MLTFVRTVAADAPSSAVYAFLADFTSVNAWDPRASGARRVEGDGGTGSVYECEVAFAGRTVPMRYTVTRLEPDAVIEWVGESDLVAAHDLIELRSHGGTTVVEYTTSYRYRRLPRLADRLAARSVARLCDDARAGLQSALDALGGRARVG
ncbi:hypothetical protein F4692_003231 [Nocardioides cavernae]|uniref:Polyketide cyclase n=1 Tax=Nocardioides cavernae TaxID=1921566 RepID=A0A7Y9H5J3_9ACTN|nr:SRPBCC family protein [Nocardioides cavernae]NYE38086.1 hypothetical protein [Nocardioides cavernae]